MHETDLTLAVMGQDTEQLPPFSSRECTQILTPIPCGELRRTVNGKLLYLGTKQHQKFASTIRCQDKAPIALDGVWRGAILHVGCIQRMTQAIVPQSLFVTLNRPAIAGSLALYSHEGKMFLAKKSNGQKLTLPSEFKGGFASYRPLLKMVVKDYQLETNEWGLVAGWRLELEEQ